MAANLTIEGMKAACEGHEWFTDDCMSLDELHAKVQEAGELYLKSVEHAREMEDSALRGVYYFPKRAMEVLSFDDVELDAQFQEWFWLFELNTYKIPKMLEIFQATKDLFIEANELAGKSVRISSGQIDREMEAKVLSEAEQNLNLIKRFFPNLETVRLIFMEKAPLSFPDMYYARRYDEIGQGGNGVVQYRCQENNARKLYITYFAVVFFAMMYLTTMNRD